MGVPCCICEVIASSCQARDPFMETAFLVDQPEFKKHFILFALPFYLFKQLHIVFMVNVYDGHGWSAATWDSSNFLGFLNASEICCYQP